MPARSPLRGLRREDGYTLVELPIGFGVALVIAVAVMAFILISARQFQGQEERISTLDETRNALQQMTHELRDASLVTVVDARTVDAQVRRASSGFDQVRYQCAPDGPASTCTRANITAGGGAAPVAEGVVNTDNFAILAGSGLSGTGSEGGAVAIKLQLDLERAENPIVLESAVKPRNCVANPGIGVVNPPC
ncbi:MAG: PulJ/GspJ family protein [Solirubrobacterales bacterium]